MGWNWPKIYHEPAKIDGKLTKNRPKILKRHLKVGEAKQNVREVLNALTCFRKRPEFTYAVGFFFIFIRAGKSHNFDFLEQAQKSTFEKVIGPLIEYVHMGVDIKNYVKLIDCEDHPLQRNIRVNRIALLAYLIFIVLGIMFMPVRNCYWEVKIFKIFDLEKTVKSSNISLRRHREVMGSQRIKTFELVKGKSRLDSK